MLHNKRSCVFGYTVRSHAFIRNCIFIIHLLLRRHYVCISVFDDDARETSVCFGVEISDFVATDMLCVRAHDRAVQRHEIIFSTHIVCTVHTLT